MKGKAGIYMEREKILPRLCFYISGALGVVGMILRTVCMLTQYDAAIGYFNESALTAVTSILYYIAILATIVSAILIPKEALGDELHTPHRAPFAYVMGLVFALFTVFSFITSYSVLFTAAGWMRTALTLCGLFAASYFLLSASHRGKFRDGLIWLSYLPILWNLLAIAVTYSDPYVPMNSPLKLSLQVGMLGFCLIMTSEIRYRLGKPLPRGAVALTGTGVYLTLSAGLPMLIAASEIGDALYPLCAGVLLFGGIYGGYMLFCYTHCTAPAPAHATDAALADTTEPDES